MVRRHRHPAPIDFRPPPWLRSPHLQTLVAAFARRGAALRRHAAASVPSILATPDGDRLRVHWFRHGDGDRPVLVLLHGLTGCAAAPNILGPAAKAARRGLDVVRVDLRNASGPTPSLGIGHAGRSEDLRVVLEHVTATVPGAPIGIVAHSLGGNLALKAVAEYGHAPPPELRAVAAVSVPIDLDAAATRIDAAANLAYRRYFLRRLRRTLERRRQRSPELYGDIDLEGVDGIRAFDDAVVAPLCGFADARDYYRRSSAGPLLATIRVPTLLIQARDDPFIPFDSFRHHRGRTTETVRLLDTERGGHVGFLAAASVPDVDRWWAENRALGFVARATGAGRT